MTEIPQGEPTGTFTFASRHSGASVSATFVESDPAKGDLVIKMSPVFLSGRDRESHLPAERHTLTEIDDVREFNRLVGAGQSGSFWLDCPRV